MLGITPAWFLYISLLCLLAETRGRTGEGIGTRNSRTSFQENRSQGSARTGGDVDQALQELQGQTGEVYVPGTSGYQSRKLVMNAACTDEPAIIVVPNTDLDVAAAVKAAKNSGLPLSVRSGGHSYTCNSIKQGSLHVDMRSMAGVELVEDSDSPTGLAALLGAGATWGSVLRTLPPTTYSYPHGQCRSVGVAGYLLGGGVNWLGTYNKYGYGAESVLSMRAVLSDGRVADITPDKTEIIHPAQQTILHTNNNNLFFALRGAGSSYGIVTQFKYIIHPTPESLPAILLAWADNTDDLQAIKAAAQDSPDYSITISEEFTRDFWQNAKVAPIYKFLFPPIMSVLRKIGRKLHGTDSFPVFLTVTDIRSQATRTTNVIRAADYVKSKGVRLVMRNNFMLILFHIFAEVLYEANIIEQEQWEAGEYQLASLNFGSLDSHAAFEDVFFNDPNFGNKRSDFLKSVNDGCDYCFWMIHYRNRQYQTPISALNPISTERSEEKPDSLDTNLVCMFKDPTSDCSAIVNDIKERIEAKAEAIDPTYTKYVNFPSCSNPSWAEKYWGSGVSTLETIKTEWDPDNLFNHCQSIGSSPVSGQGCCPFSDTVTTTTTASASVCKTVTGQTCVFPFTHQGVTHSSCTYQGGYSAPWCSTLTSASGDHVIGNYGDCDISSGLCTAESDSCRTVSGAKPNLPCVFPFRFDGQVYNRCVSLQGEKPWCSTLTNAFGVHVTGNWGDCDKNSCPMA